MSLLGYVRQRLFFKIGFVTLFAIALGFIGYSMWNSREAGRALQAETRESSQRLARGLIAGIESAMIGGNGILVSDLIQSARDDLPTVSIHVYDTHGAPVFEPRGPAPARSSLPAQVQTTLVDATRSVAGTLIHRPIANEPRCHECHDPKAVLRGVLAIELDAQHAEQHRDDILGVVLTDAFEQVMVAKKTELLDGYFAELRERVPSISGVAVYDADGSLTFGEELAAPTERWTQMLADAMRPGTRPHTVEFETTRVRVVPLPLEKRCMGCHKDEAPVRGALVVSLVPLAPGGASAELEGVIDTSLRTIMMSALGRLVTRFLATVANTRATRELRLYDAEGRLYYDAGAVPMPPPGVAEALATQRGFVQHDTSTSLIVVEPLVNEARCAQCHGEDQPLRGAIEIRASTDRAARARQQAVSNALRFAAVTIVIVFVLLGFALKRIVVDPVRRIGEFADQVGNGNLAVAEVRGAGERGDEVARLGSRMNEMVRGLRAKLHLEKFVSKGTLAAAAGASSHASMEMSREGVRRVCTVLFTDIRGFTAFSEQVEPEIVVRMLNRMLAAQAAVVERFGGDIDKFVGDELMAVFHGDDGPARAVQCALGMIEAVERARDGAEAIAVGAGISYGEVVYGAIGAEMRMDFTVIGDVVNIGARLCSSAAASEVLVSAAVHAQAGVLPRIEFVRVEPLLLKGKCDPLETYRAVAAHGAPGNA